MELFEIFFKQVSTINLLERNIPNKKLIRQSNKYNKEQSIYKKNFKRKYIMSKKNVHLKSLLGNARDVT